MSEPTLRIETDYALSAWVGADILEYMRDTPVDNTYDPVPYRFLHAIAIVFRSKHRSKDLKLLITDNETGEVVFDAARILEA